MEYASGIFVTYITNKINKLFYSKLNLLINVVCDFSEKNGFVGYANLRRQHC